MPWVAEQRDGRYVNIAQEAEELQNNGKIQTEKIRQLRKEIAAIEHGYKIEIHYY